MYQIFQKHVLNLLLCCLFMYKLLRYIFFWHVALGSSTNEPSRKGQRLVSSAKSKPRSTS